MHSILVIDDDYAMRRGISLMLRGEGYAVFEAQDRREAVRILSEQTIDLALIDLFLEHDDGITIADDIRRQHPHTKLVIVTAHGDSERARLAHQIFKENYLEKSLLEERLLKKIEDVLSSQQSVPSAGNPTTKI